jgi:beta-glucosidase
MKALKSTGKPLVFVMMTGSAIAIPWEAENVPAIVNAWYGGQSAGIAIADVLFGDYNPAGRLPVTFYASDRDLPDFDDYSMQNRTYRYFKGKPLYAFGHGLSYTTFAYTNLGWPASFGKRKNATIRVTVSNTGNVDGEEVVQLYVAGTAKNGLAPIRSLKGFQRIFLKSGEAKQVQFNLTQADLSILDDKGNPQRLKGKVILSAGGSQPDITTLKSKKSTQAYLNL